MKNEKLREVAQIGHSLWFDNIQRSMLEDGRLEALVQAGVSGLTSNPTIFEKAIAGSSDYDAALERLVAGGKSAEAIYDALTQADISRAADLLAPVYRDTAGRDGYVSLEVSPLLAHDKEHTVAEARCLFADLSRPNTMIKVPATRAGVEAIEVLIGDGVNVNATLIFSVERYRQVAGAYLTGLTKLAQDGGDLSRVASVASFFVSRVDTAVDRSLAESKTPEAAELRGTIGIANSKVAYAAFREIFSGSRWEKLAAQGAQVQRPLWASTGVKDPALPDTYYVEALIGPDTVDTLPPATLDAFLDHGQVQSSLELDLSGARQRLERLAGLGVDLPAITDRLEEEGVHSFARSYRSLLDAITEKKENLLAEKETVEIAVASSS